MKSSVIKRSIAVDGHKTSISLEDAFWSDLKDIAHSQQTTLSKLVAKIDETRQGNLSSAIRLFILEHMRNGGARKVADDANPSSPGRGLFAGRNVANVRL
jgi:predicted DNA-binding ribbon-helix-helix protein